MALKWLQHEDDYSTSPGVRVKNAWSYMSAPPYAFLALCLMKHRDNFNFTFPLYLTGTCCFHTIQMMAPAISYDTFQKVYQTIRCHIAEDSNIQSYRHLKLQSNSPPYPFKWAWHVFDQYPSTRGYTWTYRRKDGARPALHKLISYCYECSIL
jgi:hypothetical protein